MCGIAGYIDFNKQTGQDLLKRMTDSIRYRGPDDSGHEIFDEPGCTIGLGQRRLSVIDLSPLGHQPMFSSDGRLAIIFNGEVYNYEEVKKELVEKGYTFKSGSDTEVILYAYREWGAKAVERFTGMFVYVIYDKDKQTVHICRDRLGVKPLYYYWHNGLFMFASELKPFLEEKRFSREIDEQAFYSFLHYSYVPAPLSIFKHTCKLEAGHHLTLHLNTRELKDEMYWDILRHFAKDKWKVTEAEAMDTLEEKLRKACSLRMVSDVPVGVFLSGGYDSTLVTALLQTGSTERLKTYTIGFREEKFNEAEYAAKVAQHLQTDHHEMYCTYEDAKSIIPELPYFYDEPFADSSAIPTILVSRFARKSVTVALSADGGDELFAGYERHASLLRLADRLRRIPSFGRKPLSFLLRNAPGGILKKIVGDGKNLEAENISKYAGFISGKYDLVDMADFANQSASPSYIHRFIQREFTPADELFRSNTIRRLPGNLDKILSFDYLSYLPGDILTKVDRATMSISLEGREPLLDHNLIEWVAALPDELKYNGTKSKYLLRKIVHKYVPQEMMERPKMGFSVPLHDWFRNDLKYLFEEHLGEAAVAKHGMLHAPLLRKELDAYYAGNNFHFPLLWNFFMFQLWYNRWM
jgi:asparagine synthase (glutamine-hydrolysing)